MAISRAPNRRRSSSPLRIARRSGRAFLLTGRASARCSGGWRPIAPAAGIGRRFATWGGSEETLNDLQRELAPRGDAPAGDCPIPVPFERDSSRSIPRNGAGASAVKAMIGSDHRVVVRLANCRRSILRSVRSSHGCCGPRLGLDLPPADAPHRSTDLAPRWNHAAPT
jgi:hypothetical protein